ncbi:GTPase IMAP family member 9 isoform X2 [Tachysurus vachellii]|uniref:GTPase IMAP family member 9 isoform X2 n=1 Tax=Tachysurus vachellii TaxID=175792 RepID=UPI00296B48B0|nr:GTPase IMAP family member 9 isoform X2 [Tachysurus vachellii]XP_060728973.1 GTPase IMAP family member 9 isoform X2 [Tachysurus vachellii]
MSANKQEAFTDTVQIVLIGASGSGKSCSGNTILGQKLFASEASAKSVTCEFKMMEEIIKSWQVKIMDTPGWDCTELTKHDAMLEIKQAVQCLDGPYSFLLVIRAGSMETEKEINQIYDLKRVLGPSFMDHTTILFTRSDDLEGKSFKDFIREGSGEFYNLLKQCGYRHHCWNNRDNRRDDAVERLLKDLKKSELRNTCSQTNHKEQNPSGFTHYCDQEKKMQENVATASKRSRNAIDAEKCMYGNPIRVLFLGRNSVGKTSSIKTLLRKCVHREGSIFECTTFGLTLKLVESHGIDDNVERIQKDILKSLSDCSPGPHVIIIVLNIERFTPAANTAMKHVQDCLGENARKHTMILFTGADNLEGKTIENFIQENQQLSELVKIHKNRFHALNNRDIRNENQVNELLKKINDMYEQNNKEFYTKGQESPDSDQQKGMASAMSSSARNVKAPTTGFIKNIQDIPGYV